MEVDAGPYTEDPLIPVLRPFEKAVLDMTLEGNHPVLIALREQLAKATIVDRHFSGAGYFVSFEVNKTAAPLPEVWKSLQFGDVVARIEGFDDEAGSVLFVNNGYLDFLEGYSFTGYWPSKIQGFELRHNDKPEDNYPASYFDHLKDPSVKYKRN